MVNRFAFEGVGMTSKRTRDRLIQRLVDKGITNTKVLEVMAATPRHLFLDEALAHRAYEDTALPIGYGQTLSQPYIVARMTELLLSRGRPLTNVLEVGTGSGYQTAILAQLVQRVSSVERIKPLQNKARERLRHLQLRNVQFRHSDGGLGWQEAGPFDGILSAAAPAAVPEELKQQLAPDGVLIIPIGTEEQHLTLVFKDEHGGFIQKKKEAVRFVPLLAGVLR